jgi:hypothetical protein
MLRTLSVVTSLILLGSAAADAASRVAKRVIRGEAAGMEPRLLNGGFEEVGEPGRAQAWGFWDQGYVRQETIARTGRASARCSAADPEVQQGTAQTVVLNQTDPVPIVATGWSKAEGVSGSPGPDYSIYLDLEYIDGTNLWGQVSPFDTGTHDWQFGQVVVVPEKPLRSVNVYGLFRSHTGTVHFDDFSLTELTLTGDGGLFDGVPTTPGEPGGMGVAGGHFLLRDVGADSDFLEATEARMLDEGGPVQLKASCQELDLELTATVTQLDGAQRIDGVVRDLRGEDRAIAVYFVIPADFVGGAFGPDMRRAVPIADRGTYSNSVGIGVGTNGRISRYPLIPVSQDDRGLCLVTPLDVPRVSRLAYDAGSRELYAAFDLGLSRDTAKFPSSASFSLVRYGFDPTWGFRAALQRYYDLFPEFFVKRVPGEGIWMPFTDIATVAGSEDFGFRFKEGDDNVRWDDEHGILSFVYVEPMSHWLPLAAEVPRTYEAALAELERRAPTEDQSRATLNSVYTYPDGRYHLWVLNAPWCDGAVATGNPDPDLFANAPDRLSQAAVKFAGIENAFTQAGRTVAVAWRKYDRGFELVGDSVHTGQGAARCISAPGEMHGLSQSIQLGQTTPTALVARAWSRADSVTGTPDNSYALYIDLVYADGSPGFGFVAPFAVGTHDWAPAEVRIEPPKPVQSLTLHLLLRGDHGGTAWFDDVTLTQAGGEANLVQDGGFEPAPEPPKPAELDGTYIDSYEMAGTEQNFRREHWADVDVPLTFSLTTRDVCSLGIFHTYEFEQELARRMHSTGKLLFANAVLGSFAFPAHLLDVLGIETNWAFESKYAPNPDDIMSFRRAMCRHKPYLLLLNTDYNAFRPEWVELYFKRCAFYAIFPSFFSHNAADDPYWRNPTLYNRDRPLFKRYIPVIAALNAAGWEPITHARLVDTDAEVYVERYGSDPKAGVYLTLFNDSQERQDYALRIDRKALGLPVRPTGFVDLLGNGEVRSTNTPEFWDLRGSLGPEDLKVLQVSTH